MHKSTGYAVAEILISLILGASISLLLLNQQLQLSKFAGQIQERLFNLNSLENKYEQRLSGFSLSEILICLLLASLILTGLMQQYTQVYRQNSILNSRLEQSLDLQLVSELLRNTIRNAGYTPCGNIDSLQKITNVNLPAITISNNTIAITHMSGNYSEFKHFPIFLEILAKIKSIKSKRLLITDCYHVDIFEKNSSENIIQNKLGFLEKIYSPPIYVGEYIQEKFGVTEGGSLYYKLNHAEKLADYVQTLNASILDNNYLQLKLTLVNGMHYQLLTRIRSR